MDKGQSMTRKYDKVHTAEDLRTLSASPIAEYQYERHVASDGGTEKQKGRKTNDKQRIKKAHKHDTHTHTPFEGRHSHRRRRQGENREERTSKQIQKSKKQDTEKTQRRHWVQIGTRNLKDKRAG